MTLTDDAVGITDNGKVSRAVEQLLAPPSHLIDQVDVRLLNPSPDNPDSRINDDVDELADSIRSMGILEPLIVASAAAWQNVDDRMPFLDDGHYVVLAGHRRLGGARKVADGGPYLVPCIIRDDLVGADADLAMAIENGQRKDLSPIEDARVYERLATKYGMSQREIGRRVGKTQPHISKRLDLLKLPEDLHGKIGTPELSIEDAVAVAKVADDPKTIKKILGRPSWQSIDQAVDAVHREQRLAGEVKAAKERLRNQGVQNVIDRPRFGMGPYDTPTDLKWLEEDGVDVSEHEHFACHAVAVGHDYSDQLHSTAVCTNPKTHAGSRAAKQTGAVATDNARQEREEKARQKRHAGRLAAIKAAVTKPNADTEQSVWTIALEDLLEEYFDQEEYEVLAGVLGLTVPTPDADAGSSDDAQPAMDFDRVEAQRQAVREFAGKNASNLKRALIAACLVRTEPGCERPYRGSRALVAFYDLLPKHGHKLSSLEQTARKTAASS